MVYAIAQGPVSLGGYIGGGGGDSVQKNHATVGRIADGAIIEREVAMDLNVKKELTITLRNNDFSTAVRLAGVVNQNLKEGIAHARDAGTIVISIPQEYENRAVELIAAVENLDVRVDAPAKIILNERTGTVVMGENVRISTVAISHGNLTIQVKTQTDVSQPGPFSKGQTVVVPQKDVSVDEQEARLAVISAYDNGLETRGPAQPGKVMAFGTDSISRFDSLFQMHADSMAWDWKLLAAVAFKESRFDTAAVSHMGAGGLMQLMPKTAAGLGVGDSSGVNEHILAAARYLDRLDRIWRKSIPSPAQRLKFVLASYNAGPGHVKDAQRLAKDLGLDPNRWDGQVERAIVMLNRPRYFNSPDARNGYCRCQDTYWYVRDVTGLYAWVSGKKGH